MQERFPTITRDIAEIPRFKKGVSDVEAFIQEKIAAGELPATEKDILIPTPEEIEAAELQRQVDLITVKYHSVFGLSEAQFRETMPKKFPDFLPGQEGILTLPKLQVQPHPKYLSTRELLVMEEVDLTSDWSIETFRLLERYHDGKWQKGSVNYSPVIALRVADPREFHRGKSVDYVRQHLDQKIFKLGQWEELAIVRDDRSILDEIHLHLPGLSAGPAYSPNLSRSNDGGVELNRLWADISYDRCGVAIAGVNFELGSWNLGTS